MTVDQIRLMDVLQHAKKSSITFARHYLMTLILKISLHVKEYVGTEDWCLVKFVMMVPSPITMVVNQTVLALYQDFLVLEAPQ